MAERQEDGLPGSGSECTRVGGRGRGADEGGLRQCRGAWGGGGVKGMVEGRRGRGGAKVCPDAVGACRAEWELKSKARHTSGQAKPSPGPAAAAAFD